MSDITSRELDELTIFQTYVGSRAYGTETEDSDTDINSIFLPPFRYFIGTKTVDKLRDYSSVEGVDQDFFTLEYFLGQAINGSYRFVEMLFVDEDDILVTTDYGERLRDIRYLFLTNNLVKSYAGHAKGLREKLKHKDDIKQPNKKRYHQARCLMMAEDIVKNLTLNVKLPEEKQDILKTIKTGKINHFDRLIEDLEHRLDKYWVEDDLPDIDGKRIEQFYQKIATKHLSTYFDYRSVS